MFQKRQANNQRIKPRDQMKLENSISNADLPSFNNSLQPSPRKIFLLCIRQLSNNHQIVNYLLANRQQPLSKMPLIRNLKINDRNANFPSGEKSRKVTHGKHRNLPFKMLLELCQYHIPFQRYRFLKRVVIFRTRITPASLQSLIVAEWTIAAIYALSVEYRLIQSATRTAARIPIFRETLSRDKLIFPSLLLLAEYDPFE